jgi:hypothetical protein
MKLEIEFLGGSCYWIEKIKRNAARAEEVLSSQAFLERVRKHPSFDHTKDGSEQVAHAIEAAGAVKIRVGFYSKWWTRAIAYEADGAIYFNTRKEGYGAGSVGNIAHEVMHALGYSHNGNSPAGNENTVPWRVGEWVQDWA